MPELHQLEIIVNLLLQGLGKWMDAPMVFFSFLGSEEFYLLVMPLLFWCVSPILGLKFGLILVLSNAANRVLKLAFHNPRPYWIDQRVQALAAESSFGIPSNHGQTATALWGFAARTIRKSWAVIACILIILLIGLSRLYLGVHFLSDLLAGWVIGGLLLALAVRIDAPITAWVKKTSLPGLLITALLVSLGVMLALLLSSSALGSWQIPAEWSANASAARPDTPIDPLNIEDAFTLSGTLLGTLGGSALMFRRAGGYSGSGPLNHKALRYLLGAVVVFGLWYGLGKVFPRDATLLAYGLRYLRYALIGSWISLFAPLVFRRLGILE
jgi:membrane-associated phospholipid phosphatase